MAGKLKKDFELKNVHEIISNINQKMEEIGNKSLAGMIRAAILIRRDMEFTSPKVPVGETGNLRASFFIVTTKGGGDQAGGRKPSGEMAQEHAATVSEVQSVVRRETLPALAMGFSANYGVYVHENLEAKNWNRRGSGPRFFLSALERNRDQIIKIIAENARI